MTIRPIYYACRLVLFIGLSICLSAPVSHAQNMVQRVGGAFRGVGHVLGEIEDAVLSHDDDVEALAKKIDCLEHHLENYGSVVAKHPDVWGQSRLTKYRQEFEREFSLLLSKDDFEVTLQGSLRRSDQSFLAQSLALEAAAEPGGSVDTTQAVNLIGDPNASNQDIITRTGENEVNLSRFQGGGKISLEPTIRADQMRRYFDHLNELRRINEGDDTADAAGYALNLVRLPISVLPGTRTRQGYGAEITLTAHPQISPELLPETFRNLVINDLVDQLSLPMTVFLNRKDAPELLEKLEEAERDSELIEPQLMYYKQQLRGKVMELRNLDASRDLFNHAPPGITDPLDYLQVPEFQERVRQEARNGARGVPQSDAPPIFGEIQQMMLKKNQLEDRDKELNATRAKLSEASVVISIPATRNRRSRFPFPSSQITDVYGIFGLGYVAKEADQGLRGYPLSKRPNPVHLTDARGFLDSEIQAAYKLLSLPQNAGLWMRFCTPELVTLVRSRNNSALRDMRRAFYCSPELIELSQESDTKSIRTLAWAIIVESALLNDRLLCDMQLIAAQKGCMCPPQCWLPFFGPFPPPEARAAFSQYVLCRWPIIVFALDPSTQDQNIADVFAQRREMQLALAVGVAQGRVRASAASRYVRRLETDMETIALNRTHVGFSHGNETFGWRFYPRYQTPPMPGNLQAFGETLFGSDPARNLKTRELEPGIRECVAIVIMPSFIHHVSFQSRSGWFCLRNPSKRVLSLHDTMKLRRDMATVRWAAHQVGQTNCYRTADVADLLQTLEHFDRRMPFQNMLVQIPFENTLGGFELFRTGVTDLAPELHGWYGAPGVRLGDEGKCDDGAVSYMGSDDYEQCGGTCGGTTLFLVGNGFSVHKTKVIAGGRCVPFMLQSRQVMQVTVPSSAHAVRTTNTDDKPEFFVDMHVATPYGVSNHLLIPVHDPEAESQSDLEKQVSDLKLSRLSWSNTRVEGTFVYSDDGFIDADSIRLQGGSRNLTNQVYGNMTNRLLMIPEHARLVLKAVASGAGPFEKDTFELCKGKKGETLVLNFTAGGVKGINAQLSRETLQRQIITLVNKRVEEQNRLTNRTVLRNPQALAFKLETYVRLDDDSRPRKVDNDLNVTLRLLPRNARVDGPDVRPTAYAAPDQVLELLDGRTGSAAGPQRAGPSVGTSPPNPVEVLTEGTAVRRLPPVTTSH